MLKSSIVKEVFLPKRESCFEYLRKQRWQDGVRCPYCGASRIHKDGYTVNSYHSCYSTALSGNASDKDHWSTLIIVATQPHLVRWVMVVFLLVNSYHSCYSTRPHNIIIRLRVSFSPSSLLLLDWLKRISMVNTQGDGLVFYWQHCY